MGLLVSLALLDALLHTLLNALLRALLGAALATAASLTASEIPVYIRRSRWLNRGHCFIHIHKKKIPTLIFNLNEFTDPSLFPWPKHRDFPYILPPCHFQTCKSSGTLGCCISPLFFYVLRFLSGFHIPP